MLAIGDRRFCLERACIPRRCSVASGDRMRNIPYSIGIISLVRELWYTVCQMEDEPAAATFLPIFIALHQEAKTLLLPAELEILEGMSGAQAKVDKSDGGLDYFAGRASRAVDDVAEPKTKKQLKLNLFKGQPLSKFRRPVLGGQLLAQSGWGASLKASGIPALVALAPEADPLVKKGEDASKARTEATQKNREFRDIGMRKQFIDKVNGQRLLAYAALSKAPLDNPMLPGDYGDSFFLGEAASDEEPTLEEVKAAITSLKAQLAEREQTLAEMEAEAALAAQVEAERQAKQTTLDDLNAQKAELDKKIKAIEAELNK
jgi:hypothetical protein